MTTTDNNQQPSTNTTGYGVVSTPAGPRYRGNVGTPTPLTVYATCQYAGAPAPNNSTTLPAQPCTNVAMMMPGYYRACAAHIPHILLRSLNEYMQRPRTEQDTNTLNNLIRVLEQYTSTH